MKFKIDENLPIEAALLLKGDGHDAVTIMEQNLSGTPDPNIAEVCRREGRALITLDTVLQTFESTHQTIFLG